MSRQETFSTIKSIASEWRRYAEALDSDALRKEADILEKIACDFGEVALSKFHKDPGEGSQEKLLEDERKGAPVVTTEERLRIKKDKFAK
jgi:hypothetical protein